MEKQRFSEGIKIRNIKTLLISLVLFVSALSVFGDEQKIFVETPFYNNVQGTIFLVDACPMNVTDSFGNTVFYNEHNELINNLVLDKGFYKVSAGDCGITTFKVVDKPFFSYWWDLLKEWWTSLW